jgi:hypothetical protein
MGEEVTAVTIDEGFPSCEWILTDWTLLVLLGELGSKESVDEPKTAVSVQFLRHCESDSLFARNSVEESGSEVDKLRA